MPLTPNSVEKMIPLYIKVADMIFPSLIGGVSAYSTSLIIPLQWNMFFAMLIGMLIGMLSQIIVFIIGMPLFGVFEVMLPCMAAGMLSGMLGGMLTTCHILAEWWLFIFGCGVGLIICFCIGLHNKSLQGEVIC